MPHFSVIIPTYNRAHLLPMAIESVLQQSFEDFEIVISNGGSTDNTGEVVKQFSDPRIKYFESAARLSVGDNYQTGLENASGEYITFLSDDDAYTPALLQTVKRAIDLEGAEIVGYQYCRYYHEPLFDFGIDVPKNSLLIAEGSRNVTRFSARDALKQVLSIHALSSVPVDPRFICPYLSNAAYHRSVFDSLRAKRGNLFDMVPADIYLAAAVFFEAGSYHCLDRPLLVWSNWEGNSTASAERTGNKVSEHYKRLLNGRALEHTPLKFPLALNCGANAVLEAVKELDEDTVPIDWDTYFIKTYENFGYLESVGIDIGQEKEEFRAALEKQPQDIRKRVKRYISAPMTKAKALLNSRLPKAATVLRKMLNRNGAGQMKLILGQEAGFSNVVEASRFVE